MRWVKLNFLLLLIGFSCVSCFKRVAQKTFDNNITQAPYDVIIVPGYPFQDSTWHKIMKMRLYWSQYLYQNGHTKNVIYSGSAVYTPYVESLIMKEYALALGIPEEHIFTESYAKHSTENLYYSYQLAKQKGFTKIAVATDPFQNALLVRFAKKNNMDVAFLPIVFETLNLSEKADPKINPGGAYVHSFVALPDKVGFFKRFKGTLGGNIDPDLYQHGKISTTLSSGN